MSHQILFVDNDNDFLDTWAEYLQRAGYRVEKAVSLEQARQRLEAAFFHLMIVDIRMVDDTDEYDRSGMALVNDPVYLPLPKIILTDFPSYETAREAMKPRPEGLPAVYYLAKDEGPEAMIHAVQEMLGQRLRSNPRLQVEWDLREPLSFAHLAYLLEPDLPQDFLNHRIAELEELFRRLFLDGKQVRVSRLLWHRERRVGLAVLLRSLADTVLSRILVCGNRDSLAREERAIRLSSLEDGLRLTETAETMRFGAHAYAIPDGQAEKVQTLADLYHSRNDRLLRATLDQLLKEVIPAWHRRGQRVEEGRDLMALYRQQAGLEERWSPAAVRERVQALVQLVRPLSSVSIEYDAQSLTFSFPMQPPLSGLDPVTAIYHPSERYVTPVVCRLSPGRLTADSLVVDARHRAWPTDLAGLGQAPQWWDYLCLEAILRFDLVQPIDLDAWRSFEECLVAPVSLQDSLDIVSGPDELRLNVLLIDKVRKQAGRETGLEVGPYDAGLLVWAVAAMTHYDPARLYDQDEQNRAAHLLLAAAMLTRRLAAGDQRSVGISPKSALERTIRLRLDEDGVRVWTGPDHYLTLTGQQLDLFRSLYRRQGQVVPRQTLIEEVFGEPYAADMGDRHFQERRLNTVMQRLKDQLKAHTGCSEFIQTVRGEGYRLDPEGKRSG